MNRFLSIVFVVFLILVGANITPEDDNLDVARAILARKAAAVGDMASFDKLNSLIVNPSLKIADVKASDLKRRVKDGDFSDAKLPRLVDGIPSVGQKAVIFAHAAKKMYEAGNMGGFEADILRAYSYLAFANRWEREYACVEIVGLLMKLPGDLPKGYAVDFAMLLPYSHVKLLIVFSMGADNGCMKKFYSSKDTAKDYGGMRPYFARASVLRSAKGKFSTELVRHLYIDNFVRGSAKSGYFRYFKYPLYAFVCRHIADDANYRKYSQLSISDEQMSLVACDYYNYIRFAATVFCLIDEPDKALSLLERLPKGHDRNLVVKHIASLVPETRYAVRLFCNSVILQRQRPFLNVFHLVK